MRAGRFGEVAVIDPSARVHCEHAKDCPGCPLIDLPYAEQLEAKRRAVVSSLSRFSELARSDVSPSVGADPIVEYRRRAKLAASGVAVGLYGRGSHAVVDLPRCRVQDPLVLRIVARVRDLSSSGPSLQALDVTRVPAGALVTLVVEAREDDAKIAAFSARLREAEPSIVGVAVSRRAKVSHRLLGDAPTVVLGEHRVKVPIEGETAFHYAAHGAFAQAHGGQERALRTAISSAVSRGGFVRGARILELFAGSGALSISLSARGARVVAVESFVPAAELARDAAFDQKLDVEVEANDAEETVRRLADMHERFDAVVANPPRRGLGAVLRRNIAELAPETIVYVSCEPRTLARDLADFARRGYAPRSVTPYDMMPLTEEVETLVVLGRAAVPDPHVLFSDETLIAVAKAPHEPTIPQGEHEGSLLARVRRLEGAESAVPVHRLDVGTSGVCLFARRAEHAAELGRTLSEGQKEYLALLRGIARKKGVVNRPIVERGRPLDARTRYVRADVVGGHSLVHAYPEHGRKHQVRRHVASIGHDVVGDERYGDRATNLHFAMKHGLDRPFLHAHKVEMHHRGRTLEIVAPLAPDLELVLESLSASRTRPRDP
jgi:23S rRNA (uracil1939-C5)-methyltransferase